MALFLNKWGDIRGKVADLVFSTNAGGSYIRGKVTPINPMSSKQIAARARLAQMSAEYSYTLTDAQRSGWNHLAKNAPYKNIFGESKNLNGLAMFVKINTLLLLAGSEAKTDAPNNLQVRPLVVEMTAGPDTETNTFTVEVSPTPSLTESILFYCTPATRPSISFVKNLYRYSGANVSVVTAEQTLTIDPTITSMIAGMKISGLVCRLNQVTGGITLGVPIEGIIAQA